MSIATAGNIGAGFSRSINELIGLRVLQAIGSSAAMVTGVGVIADIFPKEDIGLAMSTFFVGILIGPIMGPILGGFLDSTLGWESTFFFLAILSGTTTILFLVFFKETLPRANKRVFPITIQARPPRIQRGGPLFNPFSALAYLKYPSIFMAGTITAICFGVFFVVESFHSRAMVEIYEMKSSNVGLTFVVLGFGSAAGNFSGGHLADFSESPLAR
ncbi:hypothetical protein DSO57_1009953 [Entomophthora muscae]|uniref:Uncharacterized protein n=1 Tax=Entomophthora muscae TaxID=34485 RepID=A0ACC2UGG0_9FUNG|nr:hypothetical protein DSO57_1009953 [Entomophthora muscae]